MDNDLYNSLDIPTKTKEDFLALMLGNLNNTEDKSPNAFSYDILSSTSIVFKYLQDMVTDLFGKFDVTNLEDEELDIRVSQIAGLERKPATKATGTIRVTGEADTEIPKDSVFMAEDLAFVTTKDYKILSSGVVMIEVECMEPGGVGNVVPGAINAMADKIRGVQNITNPEAFVNGYDEEHDWDLIERYLDTLANPPKAGNPAHYKLWATEYPGIWEAKVFRTDKGPSTVRVVVVGLDRKALDEATLKKVKAHILEEAPIAYENLTVESAKVKDVVIQAKILTRNGDKDLLTQAIQENLDNFLYKLAFRKSYVSYAKVGQLILDTPGVKDYEDLTINGAKENLALGETEIPSLKSVTISLVEVDE